MQDNVVQMKPGRGGARPGAGRPRGSLNRSEQGASVYVIGEADSPAAVKFGKANDVRSRLVVLQVSNFRPLKVYAVFAAASSRDAHLLEKSLHLRFAPLHVRGEWFSVSPEDAIAALEEQADLLGLQK